jgi:hypothetical protein
MKPLFLSLFAFSVACGTAEKDDTSGTTTEPSSEPASAPTSSPTSEPEGGEVLLYITQQWSGEWTIADGTMSGTESFLKNQAESLGGDYACNSVWDMTGTTVDPMTCEDCVWEVNLSAAFNATSSTLNGTDCDESDYDFTYAYTMDYQYEGESMGDALLYGDAGNDLGAFVTPNNPNNPDSEGYTSEISWDEATGAFSYTSGYKDYEYLYQY